MNELDALTNRHTDFCNFIDLVTFAVEEDVFVALVLHPAHFPDALDWNESARRLAERANWLIHLRGSTSFCVLVPWLEWDVEAVE